MAYIKLGLIVAITLVAKSLQQDPIIDFCRRWGHRTAQVDGRLYIDGGMVEYNQQSANYPNQWLLFSDLRSKPQDPSNMPTQHANLTKPPNIPSVSGGYLWADETNKCFYQFGGEYAPGTSPSDFSLFTYDVLLDKWNSTKYTSSERNLQRLSYGAGTQTESLGLGYYYGGYVNNRTTLGWSGPDIAIGGMVEFDFNKGTLKNLTGPDTVGRAEGQMVFLPVSDRGVLIYFGGIEDPSHNGSALAADMRKIHIYDIASSRWYNQTASGDVPMSRRQFCADVTWADDESSFNIYLYGGESFTNDRPAFNDVYILSLPSFQWVKGYPLDGSDALPDAAGHGHCTSNIINRSQNLVIGGLFPDPSHTDCDAPNAQGQHNMIVGNNTERKFLWDNYDPSLTTYEVPPVVLAAIGGGPTGGATVTAPATWDHPDLKNYYQLRPTFAARSATRSVPTPSASSTTPVSPSTPKKTNVAAIAGGAAGGLVAAIAILSLILFCLHRRKKAQKQQTPPVDSAPAPPPAELAVTMVPQEMSTPSNNKYISIHEDAYADSRTPYTAEALDSRNPYSGISPMHSHSPSHDYASSYHTQLPPSYGASSPPTQSYAFSNETGHVQTSPRPRQTSNAELFFPDDSIGPTNNTSAWSQQPSPQPSQRQYSYPTPTSPLQQPNMPVQPQPQVYYPPPSEPATRSHRSQPSFSEQRGSPGTQYSRDTQHGHSPNASTMTTPAQFYAQPRPVQGGIVYGASGRSSGGPSPV